jgi:hypothetical protein
MHGDCEFGEFSLEDGDEVRVLCAVHVGRM